MLCRPLAGRHEACLASTRRIAPRRFGPCQAFFENPSSIHRSSSDRSDFIVWPPVEPSLSFLGPMKGLGADEETAQADSDQDAARKDHFGNREVSPDRA